MQFVGSDNCI